jgi:hypothetical protein
MVTRRFARLPWLSRFLMLAAILPSGLACVGARNGTTRVVSWSTRGGENRDADDEIRLPVAEQMIEP